MSFVGIYIVLKKISTSKMRDDDDWMRLKDKKTYLVDG